MTEGTAQGVGVEHRVAAIRATGRTEQAVADDVAQLLADTRGEGWSLQTTVPFIYNSAATGYLIAFLRRDPVVSLGGGGQGGSERREVAE